MVAQVLPFGGADFFGPMIGGIAITPDTLTRVITDMVTSLHRHGLPRIVVINGHGGDVGPIAEVAREVYHLGAAKRDRRLAPHAEKPLLNRSITPRSLGRRRFVMGHGSPAGSRTGKSCFWINSLIYSVFLPPYIIAPGKPFGGSAPPETEFRVARPDASQTAYWQNLVKPRIYLVPEVRGDRYP